MDDARDVTRVNLRTESAVESLQGSDRIPRIQRMNPSSLGSRERRMKTTGRPPAFLRVHAPAASAQTTKEALPTDSFWQAFCEATGWAVTEKSSSRRGPKTSVTLQDMVSDGLLSGGMSDDLPIIGREAATRLAESAQRVMRDLRSAEAVIRRQEAELAAKSAPPMSRRAATDLSKALTKILRNGCAAARCAAAGFYTLDDDTAHLKLRARFGIPQARLQDPARPLRGAMADLEALVSNLCVMERLQGNPQWSSPEPWESAMCAVVMVDGLPIGTLWMWRSRAGRYGKAARAGIAMTAERISLELQHALAKRSSRQAARFKQQRNCAANWQQQTLAQDDPLSREWRASGWLEAPGKVVNSWHTWDILPDGMIAFAVGRGIGRLPLSNAFTAAALRGAWQAHLGYRHGPAQVLNRVADTLWQTSSEPAEAALLYAKIDPDTGEGDVAWAGDFPVLIASRFGYRAVCESCPNLCSQPDLQPRSQHLRLQPGECLVVATPGLLRLPTIEHPGRLTQQEIAGIVRDHLQQKPSEILSAVRRQIATTKRVREERGLVLLQHLPPVPTTPVKPRRTSKRDSASTPSTNLDRPRGTKRATESKAID